MNHTGNAQVDWLVELAIDEIPDAIADFILKATGKNIDVMMSNVAGNIKPKDHLDIQRTLNEAMKAARIVPYYPNSVIVQNTNTVKSGVTVTGLTDEELDRIINSS